MSRETLSKYHEKLRGHGMASTEERRREEEEEEMAEREGKEE